MNVEGDSHKPCRDSDYGDNDSSLPDGNAAAPGPSSDLEGRKQPQTWDSHAEDNKRGGENESKIRKKLERGTS